MSDTHTNEAHTGPTKTPNQWWVTSILVVVALVFIIGLAMYVGAGHKPAASADNLEKAVAERIQKVGSVEIRDVNRPLRTGEEVFKAQCSACHAAGVAGAPKFGDAAAWAPRIQTGFDALVQSAMKGKNAMPKQSGGDFNDTEVARGVAYMANAGGAKFTEPAAPAAAASDAAASAPAAGASAN